MFICNKTMFALFFITLINAATSYAMNDFPIDNENKYKLSEHTIIQSHQNVDLQKINPVEELKSKIQKQTKELIYILETPEFQETAFKKGWLNKDDPEQGQLIQFLKEIDPSKKYVLTSINKELAKFNNEAVNQILLLVTRINADISTLPDLMIESKIIEYFKGMNIGNILSIDDNNDGVQLKRIVTVEDIYTNIPLKWYVKTHAGGLLRDTKKSTSKPVDPIELLTYKILEYSGYGTESHFFYDDARNFYIGTKDVAAYSDNKSVNDYPRFLKKDKSDFTQEICEQYPLVEENPIIQGLFASDILSRVLLLTDILTQDGNIVFIKNKDTWQLKIIDFRNNISGYGYPDGSMCFGGLVDGNGQFCYVGQNDKIMSYYLGDKKLSLRINFACNFDYKNLRAAIGKAEGEMYNYMNLKENFDLFKNIQTKVYEHSAAIQNIISQFEKAAITYNENEIKQILYK